MFSVLKVQKIKGKHCKLQVLVDLATPFLSVFDYKSQSSISNNTCISYWRVKMCFEQLLCQIYNRWKWAGFFHSCSSMMKTWCLPYKSLEVYDYFPPQNVQDWLLHYSATHIIKSHMHMWCYYALSTGFFWISSSSLRARAIFHESLVYVQTILIYCANGGLYHKQPHGYSNMNAFDQFLKKWVW